MNDNQFDKELMDYVDGRTGKVIDGKVYEEGEALKEIVARLKKLPLHNLNPETDSRLYQFIEQKSSQTKQIPGLRRWLPFIAAAASVFILIFVFTNKKSFQEEYRSLSSNPDKLNFIYDLNNQVLSSGDINWLKGELKSEINPNIKITIVDLLSNHKSKLDKGFFDNLQHENYPSVQMALLNTLETSKNIDYKPELISFLERNDLDHSVKLKVKDMLSSQFN